MEMPAYWLRRPEMRTDAETLAAHDRLVEEALAFGPERPIDYRLGVPKWQFLCHAAERANLVLHGSGDPGIRLFEPRQPADTLEFSNRRAIFAAVDGIWPVYYAILDRERYPMRLLNACVYICSATGEAADRYYFFSISRRALARRPWRGGMVYLLPADSFQLQPRRAVGQVTFQIAQAASPVPVTPVAKLAVGPGDFPFLEQVRGHDDELLRARIAADPDGFPWVEA
ncbi:MAG: hypothetical protein J2P27_14290 [Actinobacteria bacterium]|nr:hypothetical protein [Actinomycetota bacterium]